MVSKKTNKRKAIKKKKKNRSIFWIIFAVIMVGLLCAGFYVAYDYWQNHLPEPSEPESEPEPVEEPEPEPQIEYKKIDFQPVVNSWVTRQSGNKSVLIYDLERNEIVGAYNMNSTYDTASLYKLFGVYEGYRRVQNGEWSLDEPVGSTGYTVQKCLDLAIRESHSVCAESIIAKMGGGRALNSIIANDYGINNTDVVNLTSTPEDIMKIMQKFYTHEEITDESLIALMKDSFLNQPATTYDWRQGLPSGFKNANVYNKVGWDYNADKRYWNIYHDAAIVEFPEQNRHYIVVVMTNRVPFEQIRKLGTDIENRFLEN